MKPVIITLNSNGKVVMSIEEFKRHMDAAYNHGYSDGNSAVTTIATPSYGNHRWWTDITCNGTALNTSTCVDSKVATTATADDCDCIAGYCNCDAECLAQASTIKDYIKIKGE